MDLRRELTPPELDSGSVALLTSIAERLDHGDDQEDADVLIDGFNRIAATDLSLADFQGTYGAEDHEAWVRRVLLSERIKLTPGATRDELVEVARRAMDENKPEEECDAYRVILDANITDASNLIFHPPPSWPRNKPRKDWKPTPEQVVDTALEQNRPICL